MLALARGINGLGGALGEAAVVADQNEDVIVAQEDRLAKAGKLVEFTKLQGDWSRDYLDLRTKAPVGDTSFEENARAELDKRISAFQEGLPAKLRPEFSVTAEEFKQSQFNEVRNDKINLQTEGYKTQALDLQYQIQETLLKGTKRREEWQPVIDEFFANSPFDAATTADLKGAFEKDAAKLQLELDAAAELTYPEYSHMNVGELPAGMPPEAMALLQTMIGTEAPDFQTIYGGQKFSDFSDHPNVAVEITEGPNKGKKSTAAGLPQFVYSTWKEVQAATGLPDFSPPNQIRGMWYLAQRDYKSRTGRDLQSDMASGSPIILDGVRRNLAPTWEAFGKMSTDEFISRMSGAKGTPPSIFDDPAYKGLSPVEQRDIYERAVQNAQQQRSAYLEQQSKETVTKADSLVRALQEGQATPAQVDETIASNNFTSAQVENIRGAQKKYDEDNYNYNRFLGAVANGSPIFDEEAKKGAEIFMVRTGNPALQNQDTGFVQTTLLPIVEKAGRVPETTVTTLESMRTGGRPDQMQFAYETLALLQQRAPTQFGALPKAMQDDSIYYGIMSDYKPAAEIAKDLKAMNTPEFKQLKGFLEPRLPAIYKDNGADFSVEAVLGRNGYLSGSINYDSIEASAFVGAFQTEFEQQFYRFGGDYNKAYQAAQQSVATQWDTFNTGGDDYLMRYPPTKAPGVPSILGSYDWIVDQTRSDFKFAETDEFQLKGDAQTKSEFMSGNPSWAVVKRDSVTGVFLPILGENNRPLRMRALAPDGSTQKSLEQIGLETETWARNRDHLVPLLNEAASTAQIDTSAPEFTRPYALLQKTYEYLDKNKPRYGKADPYASQLPTLRIEASDAEIAAMLDKLGYNSLEAFAQDIGKYGYGDLLEALQ